jgi:type IV pilus assembly protein PilA
VDTKQKSFSTIELRIAVAIILIIAAVAISNLLRSRMTANEVSAVGSMRTMNTAANTYGSTYGNGLPPSLAFIGTTGTGAVGCQNASLLDTVLTSRSCYSFLAYEQTTRRPNA